MNLGVNAFFCLGKQGGCVVWLKEQIFPLRPGPERRERTKMKTGLGVAVGVQVCLRAAERLVRFCCCLEFIFV